MDNESLKRRILNRIQERIQAIDEWPDSGTARMGLLQIAYEHGWYVKELN